MARFVHKEQSEITMDYENLPDASARGLASNSRSGEHGEVTVAASGETEILLFNKHFEKCDMDKI